MSATNKADRERRKDAYKKTQELLNEAVVAVNALSIHLQDNSDLPRMYKANHALHILWDIK